MSEHAYRRFMERHQRRTSTSQHAGQDAWMNEPVMGAPEQDIGVLGLPLSGSGPDWADILLDLLASADEPPLAEAQAPACAGQGGDTEVVHLAPGERVVAKRLQTSELDDRAADPSHRPGDQQANADGPR